VVDHTRWGKRNYGCRGVGNRSGKLLHRRGLVENEVGGPTLALWNRKDETWGGYLSSSWSGGEKSGQRDREAALMHV
jgi:hypothetical protein